MGAALEVALRADPRVGAKVILQVALSDLRTDRRDSASAACSWSRAGSFCEATFKTEDLKTFVEAEALAFA